MRYEVVAITLDADEATASIPALGYELYDEDNDSVSCACDEAIARCLAEQFAVEEQGVVSKVKLRSYLEAASSVSELPPKSAQFSNKGLNAEYRQENNADDLEEAALQAASTAFREHQQNDHAANFEEVFPRVEKVVSKVYQREKNAAAVEEAALRSENMVWKAYRQETSAAELEEAAHRAERMALFARQEIIRCRPDALGRDRAKAMRERMNELRDESCACYLAARNLHLILPPIPRRFDAVVAVISRSIAKVQEPRLDLHQLPRVEALKILNAAINGLSDAGSKARRLEVIVGRGIHSRRHPVLGSFIISHLNKLGLQYQHDETHGVLFVHLRTSATPRKQFR